MENKIKILFVEDLPSDNELSRRVLKNGGIDFDYLLVETESAFADALEHFGPDIIISDYKMPLFNGMKALQIRKEKAPFTPFVLLTGSINEEVAVECMKAGATDYILKEHNSRLPYAVREAIAQQKALRAKAEADTALRESENRYRTLIEQAADGIFIADANGYYTEVNTAGCRMLGYTREELYQKNIADLIAAESLGSNPLHYEEMRAGKSVTTERMVKCKDGSFLSVEVSGTMLSDGRFLGVVRDISERLRAEEALRLSEEKFSKAFRTAPYAITITRVSSGNFIDVNDGFIVMTGYTRDEALAEKSVCSSIWINPEDPVTLTGDLMSGKEVVSRECEFRKKDGTMFTGLFSAQFITLGDEQFVLSSINDITERKFVEKQVREKSARIDAILRTMPDILFVIDKQGYFKEFYAPDTEILVIPPGKIVESNIRDVFGAEEGEKFLRIFAACLESGKLEQVEYLLVTPKGPMFFEARISPLDSGNVLVIIRTISDRKKAEQAVQESVRNFKELFDEAPVGYHEIDTTGKILRVNETELKMLGYGIEEMIGRDVWEFVADKETSRIAVMEKLSGKPIPALPYEREFMRKNGTPIPVLVEDKAIYDAKGNIVSLRSTLQDYTEFKRTEAALRESEIKYRGLVEASPDAIAIYVEGKIVYANSASVSLMRASGVEELLGKPVLEFVHPDNREFVVARMREAAESGKVLPLAEEKFIRLDGTPVFVEVKALALTFENKPAVQIIVRDISERRRAEMIQKMQYNIANAVVNSRDIESLYESVRAELGSVIDTRNFYVAFYNEKTGMLSAPFEKDEKDSIPEWPAEYSLTGYMLRQKKPLLLRKAQVDQLEESGIIKRIGTNSEAWLGVPLFVEGKTYGAIVVQNFDDPNAYDVSSIETLEIVAHELSIYIERKNAEEALKKISRAVEQSPASVVITDLRANIEYVNPRFLDVTGYSFEEVLGKNPRILKSGETSDKEYKELWNVLVKGGTWRGVFHNKKKNGELFWESASISPVANDAGKTTHYVAVKEDITEWKILQDKVIKSESQFRTIWENSLDGMRLLDRAGTIIRVNEAYCNIVELSADKLIGKPFNYPTVKQDREGQIKRFQKRFQSREVAPYIEEETCLLNGNKKWVSLSSSFLEIEGQEPMLLSIFRDITQNRQMLNELLAAKEKAEEMNRAKSSFFANMSHELRTPLIGVLGFAEMLQESLEDQKPLHNMAATINTSGHRLLRTLNLILDISKIESEKVNPRIKRTNIVPLVKGIADLFTRTAAQKNVDLIFTSALPEIECPVDVSYLNSIFNNLISNAVRFTDAGSITVSLTTQNRRAVIEVKDTGVGIPVEKQNIIWEEFRQASEGYSRNYEGTGLGLTLAKKYTELLGGTIALESSEGKGAVFTVTLPLVEGDAGTPDEEPLKQAVSPERRTSAATRKRLLYVEDDEVAVDLVSRLLTPQYDLDTAQNAAEGLRLANQNSYDAILMDINLRTGLDGVQATQEIRKIPRYLHTPVIAVTAYAMGEERKDFMAGGLTHYISKPFTRKGLLDVMREVFPE